MVIIKIFLKKFDIILKTLSNFKNPKYYSDIIIICGMLLNGA